MNERINELIRVSPRSTSMAEYRINLVLPTLSAGSAYGGVQTALDLFDAVSANTSRRRIVVAGPLDDAAIGALPGYVRVTADEDRDDPMQLVAIDPTSGATLPVGPRDVFVATFWPTAELVIRTRRWQASTYGATPSRFGYLVQDFEPSFYPWSAQTMLAAGTYGSPDATVAIFNTALLRDYFHGQGFSFGEEFTFEPRLSPTLRQALASTPPSRAPRILVYGRPRKPRNGFPLIVEGLRSWRASFPQADRWSVVSAGEDHAPVDLGDGMSLHSLGKMDMAGYARVMRSSAVGVSLMVSPHPSYPPLEMAQAGLLVLTNRFGDKDLSTWHTNIVSLREVSIGSFSRDLADICLRYVADPATGDRGRLLREDFLDEGPQFPFADAVAQLLRES